MSSSITSSTISLRTWTAECGVLAIAFKIHFLTHSQIRFPMHIAILARSIYIFHLPILIQARYWICFLVFRKVHSNSLPDQFRDRSLKRLSVQFPGTFPDNFRDAFLNRYPSYLHCSFRHRAPRTVHRLVAESPPRSLALPCPLLSPVPSPNHILISSQIRSPTNFPHTRQLPSLSTLPFPGPHTIPSPRHRSRFEEVREPCLGISCLRKWLVLFSESRSKNLQHFRIANAFRTSARTPPRTPGRQDYILVSHHRG